MKTLTKLNNYLTRLADGGLCVAFSGGVDSALLLKAACEVSENVLAVTVRSMFHAPRESAEAEQLARSFGARYHLLELDLPDTVLQNPLDRCYLCKRAVFAGIRECAAAHGIATVLDGTNADDLNEYRPGLKALAELGVKSPLAELGFSKPVVREMARALAVPVSEKPSAPCLATRLPYNTRIEPEMLAKIDAMEAYLKSLGFAVIRARVHDSGSLPLVRIEAAEDKLADLILCRTNVVSKAKALGFSQVTLDLQGFRSGSWDKAAAL